MVCAITKDGGIMQLREYQKEDSNVICSWILDEKSLYQWSAERFGKFPLLADTFNNDYTSRGKDGRFFPLTALDEGGNLVGHLYIRYPEDGNDQTVRFGFVIIDPASRGYGNGKKMLYLAIDYAKKNLGASKITLGVFANNESARYCYEAVGFCPVGKTEIFKMSIGEWECIEMELALI